MKINNPTIERFYEEWLSRASGENDPARSSLVLIETFIAGWNAGIAKAASIADAHPRLPDAHADCLEAQGCCEAIAGEIDELVDKPPIRTSKNAD